MEGHYIHGSTPLGLSMPNFWLGLLLIILFSKTRVAAVLWGYGSFSSILMPAFVLVDTGLPL